MSIATLSQPSKTLLATQPRSYRFTPFWRILVAAGAAILLVAVLGALYLALTRPDGAPASTMATIVTILAASAVGIAWGLAGFLTWRVTFTQDAVTLSDWRRSRTLRRDQIEGVRIMSGGRVGQIAHVFPSPASGQKKISLPLGMIATDAHFMTWFSGLKNLDAIDIQDSLAAITANPAFGATPDERLQRLTRARKIAKALGFVTIAVVAWCFIKPEPYPILIASLAALPVVAVILVVISRGLYRIGIGAGSAYASLGTVCTLPACALAARMLFDLSLTAVVPLVAAATIFAVGFVAAMAIADRSLRARHWMLFGCWLAAGAYGFGAIGEANALLDRSQPSVLRSEVLGKRINTGRATTYHLRLAPWGPRPDAAEVAAPHAVYDRLQPGQQACVILRNGALGMPWFIVLACPERGADDGAVERLDPSHPVRSRGNA
jgi:membrane protein YdbS with pleckstrin-like domain